jgi:hypothetical protein
VARRAFSEGDLFRAAVGNLFQPSRRPVLAAAVERRLGGVDIELRRKLASTLGGAG